MPKPERSVMSQRRQRLLALLADGAMHSGEDLAHRLRVSRPALRKAIQSLRALGVDIDAQPRTGYRLPMATDLLDRSAIAAALPPGVKTQLERFDVRFSVSSTNQVLLEGGPPPPGCAHVCVTELQTAGRGRRGRSWSAPFGSGLCFSMAWQFADAPPTFSALSLAVGVVVVRVLRRFGAQEVGLKWPNDVMWRGRKLAGVLIEMRAESAGPAHVVIGIGLNTQMPAQARIVLAEQHAALVADLRDVLPVNRPTRNLLAAALMSELIAMLGVFAQHGFAPFIEEWRSFDALSQSQVKVMCANQVVHGCARSVDEQGALLVEVDGELRRFIAGEVSLRAAAGGRSA